YYLATSNLFQRFYTRKNIAGGSPQGEGQTNHLRPRNYLPYPGTHHSSIYSF
ncbi:unnamed protein product, partial [marine sediment metagenome]